MQSEGVAGQGDKELRKRRGSKRGEAGGESVGASVLQEGESVIVTVIQSVCGVIDYGRT